IVRTLRNAIELGKVHHAYLFVGSRGTGKTSMAKLLACAMNAEGGPKADFSPDDQRARAIMTGQSLDVVEMDAASNNSVDDIRELRENVAQAPMGGGRRVYILDEAHMLSNAAWNAFLKTLEEPPAHVVFVLATTEAHKVPATIVDRCHRFDFRRPSLEHIASVLTRVSAEEGIAVPEPAIGMIARAATGSFRDALGTLEQLVTYGGNQVQLDDVLEILGVADAELILETAESLVEHDPRGALLAVEKLAASGRDVTQFMRDLAAHLRHLFVVQTLGEVPDTFAVTAEHTDRLSAQAGRLAQGEVLRAIDLLAAGLSAVKDGSDPRIQLELALLKAVQPQSDMSMQALLFRIEQLERKLAQAGTGSAPQASQPSAPPAAPAPGAMPTASPSVPAPQRAVTPPAQPQTASARSAGGVPVTATAVAAEPELQPDPEAQPESPAPEVDLDRLRSLWPAVVDEVCKENQMVGAFLHEARPTSLDGDRLLVCFAPGAGFSKKKVESNRQLVQNAVRSLTGAGLNISYELSDLPAEPESVAPSVLSEEELLERLKQEFGAKEVFDE
ncbi:MAG: polymerase subunit gamma/tau, partial [Thermoleophilaceae bacterium]|nr:polymerase subunit gamma/tau [Thermoleophilaceae bacterium]